MQERELVTVVGGSILTSAAYWNALSRAVNTIYNLGRSIGTSIRMIMSGKRC